MTYRQPVKGAHASQDDARNPVVKRAGRTPRPRGIEAGEPGHPRPGKARGLGSSRAMGSARTRRQTLKPSQEPGPFSRRPWTGLPGREDRPRTAPGSWHGRARTACRGQRSPSPRRQSTRSLRSPRTSLSRQTPARHPAWPRWRKAMRSAGKSRPCVGTSRARVRFALPPCKP